MRHAVIDQCPNARRGEPRYPLAARAAAAELPPAPRCSSIPPHDMYEFRHRRRERCESYGWVNKSAGTVHIPIEEAMRLTVERGLPSRPQPGRRRRRSRSPA